MILKLIHSVTNLLNQEVRVLKPNKKTFYSFFYSFLCVFFFLSNLMQNISFLYLAYDFCLFYMYT